ncbi:uncharacterized protein Tco025E_10049 [Trypanosoma conorhini]|uniref:Uncharacterized protein n=1 Tax=Trypanosoma conorhini TaxID=83891 RepID=A0A422MQ82_9TRYP|nr:uncharacterized protein Tco025E_10049 [Trypanosoma conorhini]RNE95353.1 hypothetical protein Tco025E_10049 [Trypanosoma conorhini]
MITKAIPSSPWREAFCDEKPIDCKTKICNEGDCQFCGDAVLIPPCLATVVLGAIHVQRRAGLLATLPALGRCRSPAFVSPFTFMQRPVVFILCVVLSPDISYNVPFFSFEYGLHFIGFILFNFLLIWLALIVLARVMNVCFNES